MWRCIKCGGQILVQYVGTTYRLDKNGDLDSYTNFGDGIFIEKYICSNCFAEQENTDKASIKKIAKWIDHNKYEEA